MKVRAMITRRGAVLAVLVLVPSSLAVDPPPAYLLSASVEKQLRYTDDAGRESERLRTRVAEQRFQAKEQKRALFADGLRQELEQQSALLASSTAIRPEDAQNNSGGSAGSSLYVGGSLGGLVLLSALGLVYYFRQ